MERIFRPQKYRKITKAEACKIQGFPADFILPETRHRWMHLIGNSVAVSVVKILAKSVVATGVFEESDWNGRIPTQKECLIGQHTDKSPVQLSFSF